MLGTASQHYSVNLREPLLLIRDKKGKKREFDYHELNLIRETEDTHQYASTKHLPPAVKHMIILRNTPFQLLAVGLFTRL